MALEKPNAKELMQPPFTRIGEPQWAPKLRFFLESFDVPIPAQCSSDEVHARESELHILFPDSLTAFLMEFGAVSFDYVEILPLREIVTVNEVSGVGPTQLPSGNLLVVASAGQSGNYFALSGEGVCYFLTHHPTRVEKCLKNFDDLVRIACIDLYASYYGWDDENLYRMRDEIMRDMFGFIL